MNRSSKANLINAILFLISFLSTPAFADFSGKVIDVYDGDTITVLNAGNEEIKIRLNGIDSQEKAQDFGKKAQQYAEGLVHSQIVTIHEHGSDRYERILGDVVMADGRILNQEMVKAGFAWWFYKYSDDRILGELELKAKLAHVGLWSESNPVPPWVFRKIKDLLH